MKFPTRGRPDFFRKAIANIYSTISTADFRILVTIDRDDESMTNPEMIEFMKSHAEINFVIGTSQSKIHAVNRDMEIAEEWDWDLLILMSDDMRFDQFGWDNTIRQRMKDNFPEGDCFLHFPDGYANEALATMSIIDRKYYERDRYIYYPMYKSFSSDAEAFFVAKARGRHKFFNDQLFTHQHPANTPVKNDQTYSVNSLATPHDTALYWDRLHADFEMNKEGIHGPFPWDQYKTR